MTESKIKSEKERRCLNCGALSGASWDECLSCQYAHRRYLAAEKALREELVAAMKEEKEARSEFERVNNSSHKLTEKVRAGERLGLAEIARDAAIVRAEQFEKEVSQ